VIVWQKCHEGTGCQAANDPPPTICSFVAVCSLWSPTALADINPLREIKRPRVNPAAGTTRAFSPKEARKILDPLMPTRLRELP